MDEREKKEQMAERQTGTLQQGGAKLAQRKKRSGKQRFLRWALFVLSCPVLLFVLLSILIYTPCVQDYLVGYATQRISEELGKKVSIERLRITPLLDVELQKLLVLDDRRLTDRDLQLKFVDRGNKVHADTLLAVDRCVLDLDMGSIFSEKIDVDAFDLKRAVVDTRDMIDGLVIDGRLKRLDLNVHDVNLKAKQVNLSHALLEGADLDIAIRDTLVVDEDSTSSNLPWMLNFRDVCLKDSRVVFHTALDTMRVRANIGKVKLGKGSYDLDRQKLQLKNLSVASDAIAYDLNYEPHTQGLDVNHILVSDLYTELDHLDYDLDAGKLQADLANLRMKERCGMELERLTAQVELDTLHLLLEDVELKTPTSRLRAEVDMDWVALTSGNKAKVNRRSGKMEAWLAADFSKDDILKLTGENLPEEISANYPDKMLTAEVKLTGNVDSVTLRSFRILMPEMLDVTASGAAGNLLTDNLEKLTADLQWEVQTWDLSLVQRIMKMNDFRIPALQLTADTHIHDGDYRANVDMRQGAGHLLADAHYNMDRDAYDAKLSATKLTFSNFLKIDSVICGTLTADVQGRGTDFLSPRSTMHALVEVKEMNYGDRDLSHIRLDALMREGHSSVNFNSISEVLDADGCVEVQIKDRLVDDAIFSVDMRGIDFHSLGIVEKPLKASMSLHMNGHTDLKEDHYLKGMVTAVQLVTADSIYYPRDIEAEILMRPDTLFAAISAGDLNLHMNSRQGLEEVIAHVQDYYAEMGNQVENKVYNQSLLKACLPDVDLCVESGRQNPLANIAAMMGYTYREFDIDLHTDTLSGINGHGWIHTVNTGSIVLDTIQFNISQDAGGMQLDSRVCNGKRNPDITFDARFKAFLSPHEASLALVYLDEQGRKGVDLGAQATFHEGTSRLHLTPLRPILAYRYFTLNDSNYISIDPQKRIQADVDLVADDGTGLKFFSTPNELAEQDLTVSMNRFNLGELCLVMPYMPMITGLLQGDVHLLKTEDVMSIGADLLVKEMTYEGSPMGDVGVNAAYMPNEDGTHFVDGFLTQNSNEILTFTGMYQSQDETDHVDADLQLERFPLAMANGFLSEMLQLEGYFNGGIHVEGPTSRPRINGHVVTEAMHLLSPNYSVDLRIPDDTIAVTRNRLDLSRLKAYSTGTRPLTLGGFVDFSDFDKIRLDVSAKASNFELINAPKNRKAEAYGKAFVNLALQVSGLLNDLSVTGNLALLGNSDLTYVLKDSPITVEDEMADLVTFVDFGDTLHVEEPAVVSPSNLTMRLGVSIDQAAQLHCLLSEDGTNYANIEGGGDLTLTYDERKGLQLFGRYTILNGRMNYSMMVFALKDCDIASGSYVDFNGPIMNPRLNIVASERLNTTITENETPRSVAFNVGMNVTQTLDNMGLEFTLAAPEDMTIQNEIAQMTAEQRGRVAVTLMATGMYVVEGKSTGGFNTTNALNAFLNTQISQIAGKALNTIDLSLGVQNTNTASGNITTDYSFRFAKRFWGNRISLIIGGKVSSGSEAENTGLSIIDNVSVEYRLDKSATRYVTLYYDNNNESILEGQVTEMGAGLVLRRKTRRLSELFRFRNGSASQQVSESALPEGKWRSAGAEEQVPNKKKGGKR